MDKWNNDSPRKNAYSKTWLSEAGKESIRAEQILPLIDCMADTVVRITLDGRNLYSSPASYSLLGMGGDHLLHRNFYELIDSSDREKVRRSLDQSAETDTVTTSEFRMRHANGRILCIEMRSHTDRRTGGDEVVAVLRNITERYGQLMDVEEQHRMEQEGAARNWQLELTVELLKKQIAEHQRDMESLEQSEMRYTTLVENTLTGIYIHDGHRMVFCNERFAQIFGVDRDTMENMNTDYQFAGGRSVEALLNDLQQEELIEGKNPEGDRIWLKLSRDRMVYNGHNLVVGNVIDITEQITTNERLRHSEQELHALSAQLMATQEQERKRIANELHDGLGQRLSAIKFAVENVWRSTDKEAYPEQARRLAAIVESIRDSIEEVRRVSMDLRPSILDDLGLIATVGWFCREFGMLFPTISVQRTISAGEDDIPDEVKVVIFRIMQEAFHNITKHAQADQIELTLVNDNNSLQLKISDNGCGISCIDSSPCAKGLGLRSMRERAEQSHGEFRIESVSGQGTMISVEWPCKPK